MKLTVASIAVAASLCGHAAAYVRLQAYTGLNCDTGTWIPMEADKEIFKVYPGHPLALWELGGPVVKSWKVQSDNYEKLWSYATHYFKTGSSLNVHCPTDTDFVHSITREACLNVALSEDCSASQVWYTREQPEPAIGW